MSLSDQNTFIATDVRVQLLTASPVALLHANLKAGTVRVKGKWIGTPRFESVTLVAQPVALASQQVIPNSVVVASDSSLGTIYTENTDYHVDHVEGTLARIATGMIGSGAAVAVWYYAYRFYVEGVDFTVYYEKGTIRRITSGAIEDGQTVFVDYQAEIAPQIPLSDQIKDKRRELLDKKSEVEYAREQWCTKKSEAAKVGKEWFMAQGIVEEYEETVINLTAEYDAIKLEIDLLREGLGAKEEVVQ